MTNKPEPIEFEDIKAGDTIRVVTTHTTTVQAIAPGELHVDRGLIVWKTNPSPDRTRTIELVSRPEPPLPEEIGSAIRFKGVLWILSVRNGFTLPYWHCPTTGAHLSRGQMRQIMVGQEFVEIKL